MIDIEKGTAGFADSDNFISSAPAATGRKSIFESTVSSELLEIAEGRSKISAEINITEMFFFKYADSAKTPMAKNAVAKVRRSVPVIAKSAKLTPSNLTMPEFSPFQI